MSSVAHAHAKTPTQSSQIEGAFFGALVVRISIQIHRLFRESFACKNLELVASPVRLGCAFCRT
jgi:hypothetical protein